MKREVFQEFLKNLSDTSDSEVRNRTIADVWDDLTPAQRGRVVSIYNPPIAPPGIDTSTQAPPGSKDGGFEGYAVHADHAPHMAGSSVEPDGFDPEDTSSIKWGADMDVDPYGTGITIVAQALQRTYELGGQMSRGEFCVVVALCWLLHSMDDASAPRSFQGAKLRDMERLCGQ
jgi:hypothetical protein